MTASAATLDIFPDRLSLLALALLGVREEDGSATLAREVAQEESRLASEVARDPEAFQTLYRRYYERILNFFFRRVCERDLAEDLTSQTFLSAFDYLSREKRSVNFRAWIFRVATNAWLSHERRQLRWGERFLGQLGRHMFDRTPTVPGEKLSEAEHLQSIRKAVMALPARYREPLLLRYDEELGDAEIALALGLAQSSVRSRIHRSLKILRQRLRAAGIGLGD